MAGWSRANDTGIPSRLRAKRDRAGTCKPNIWHEPDMPTALCNVRSWRQSGKYLRVWSFSDFGPFRISHQFRFSYRAQFEEVECS